MVDIKKKQEKHICKPQSNPIMLITTCFSDEIENGMYMHIVPTTPTVAYPSAVFIPRLRTLPSK